MQYLSKSIYLISILGLIILWTACKDEEPIVPPDPIVEPVAPQYCSNINLSLTQLSVQEQAGNLIVSVDNQDTLINIIYDSGNSITICSDSLITFDIDSTESALNILMADSSTYSGYYFNGNLDIELESILNPTSYAPLSAQLNIVSEIDGYVHLHIIGQDGPYSDVHKDYDEIQSVHQLQVLGLYFDYQNQIVVEYFSRNDLLLFMDTIIMEIEAFDMGLPDVYIDVNNVEAMAPGFQLISHLNTWPNMPFMIDPYGKVRFLFDWRSHPELSNLLFDVGMERLANGNYYFGDIATDEAYEVDVMGEVINSWPLPDLEYHHNIFEKPDYNFLLTCESENSQHLEGGLTVEDRILEMDRGTGAAVKLWDVRYLLDETRTTFVDFSGNYFKDWAHLNAVIYDSNDNTIIFSARHQSTLCKVNYQDEVQWIISPRVDFGTNRQGQDLEPFYLTAVDPNGIPYGEDVQNGSENIEEFEWPWYQHAVKLIGPNRILCFDNGNNRNFSSSPNPYSRAVIYNIDPVDMTIQQEWTYGRELGSDTYSNCCSDADFLAEQNHIIFSPGKGTDNQNGEGGRVIEVDYTTKDVIFEAQLNSGGITHHRTERLTIYP